MVTVQWISRLVELTEDWNCLIRRDGWRSALSQIEKEIAAFPYRHLEFVVVARSLSDPLPDLKAKIALEIRPFEPVDLDFVRKEHLPSEANLCAQHLALDHYGFVACHSGRIAGYAWGCMDTSLERVELDLKPGDVLCTDAFTAPAFRGKGVQTILSIARLRSFRERGCKRAIAYIKVDNAPSLAVWRKMGARVVDHVDFKRIGLWRRTRYG